MSRYESVGVQSQCAGCDQARSCWIRDTIEGRYTPDPSAIAVEERYIKRADGGDCVFFRRPKVDLEYKSRYDARQDGSKKGQSPKTIKWND